MRKKLDQYFTGDSLTQSLLDQIPIKGTVFEPCIGRGDLRRVLEQAGCEVIGNDIDETFPADYHEDATLPAVWNSVEFGHSIDWVVTNPPFKHAFAILQHALNASQNVAMLVRLSFLEPTTERQAFLQKNPPTDIVVLPRYSFSNDGKVDSVTCAWLVWRTGPLLPTTRMTFAPKKRPEKGVDERPYKIIGQLGDLLGWNELPALLGVTRQSVHLWKTGKRMPSSDTILAAIDVLRSRGIEPCE